MTWSFFVAFYVTSVLYNLSRVVLCWTRMNEHRRELGLSRTEAFFVLALFVGLGFFAYILQALIELFKSPTSPIE